MDDEAFSRRANAFFYGDPAELLCSRLWRNRWRGAWPLVWFVDLRFRQLRREGWGHCRRSAEWQAKDEPLERAYDA